ncbi:tRNA (guanosine(37)-N1)-methyltransferase TrmD [Candidatus Gracilibacteria bacterium]|nr:tRNA (guanosine(37)-N1)-methyltransferase TrmD [Candidatus Gracilibacteria bacterium]
MEIHIVSLFPESVRGYLDSSIMKQAQEKGLFRYYLHNLTDWSVKNTRRVDDRPYGGGAGTVITVEPMTNCFRELFEKYGEMPIFFMSPKGKILQQKDFENFSKIQKMIILCGHYEGVDERIFELFPITEISIGKYVLSSGELASMVFIDGVVRLVDGVLSKESLEEESFSANLGGKKEYPQYSRPQIFEGISVPEVLLSGDHSAIQDWKKKSTS